MSELTGSEGESEIGTDMHPRLDANWRRCGPWSAPQSLDHEGVLALITPD